MRAIPKLALVLAALALPLAAVIVSLLLTSGARAPGVPSQVDVGRVPTSQGGSLAPGGPPQLSEQDDQHDDRSPAWPGPHAPGQLPPPAPDDDDVDDGPGNADDQHEGNDD